MPKSPPAKPIEYPTTIRLNSDEKKMAEEIRVNTRLRSLSSVIRYALGFTHKRLKR